ncbi:MAG: response regulator [Verrucomicrobiae bacterium]|nr:response regulator [Verrucomicrobiae bacterium]
MDSPDSRAGARFRAVLLVDDDRTLVESLRAALADENFLVDAAYDGAEALLKVRVHEYDAVVCDLQMPNLRGEEFYRRAVELRPEIAGRFLFITGYGGQPEVRQFLESVSAPRLHKPFSVQELIGVVQRLVG